MYLYYYGCRILAYILTNISRNSTRYILVNLALLLSMTRNSIINILTIDFSIGSDRLYFVNLVDNSVEKTSKYNIRSNTSNNGSRLTLSLFKSRFSRSKLVTAARKIGYLTT